MLNLLLAVFSEEREHSGQRLKERQLSSSLQQREVKGKEILQNNEVKREGKNKQEEKRHEYISSLLLHKNTTRNLTA